MTTMNKTDTLQTYVGDVQALIGHGLQAIEQQVKNLEGKGHQEAQDAIRQFKEVLQQHHTALEARIKALGGSIRTPAKEAVARVAGIAAGLINKVRPEEASKSVRDDYTFLSHCAVAYLMLFTTAASLGDEETVQLAERGYQDCARLIMVVDRIMPSLVVEELRQDGLAVTDVDQRVRSMVQGAWKRESKSAGVNA